MATKQTKKESNENKIRIRVRAYEAKVLDQSVKLIVDTAKRLEAIVTGPIPLPTEFTKYTVLRSTFVYKTSPWVLA